MLNTINLMGRLTREPKVNKMQNEMTIANFSIAVDRDTKEKQTDFIDCVAFRQTAEFIGKYISKGALVGLCGRLQMRDWTDKDGNKHRVAEVVVNNIYFGEGKKLEKQTDKTETFSAVKSDWY